MFCFKNALACLVCLLACINLIQCARRNCFCEFLLTQNGYEHREDLTFRMVSTDRCELEQRLECRERCHAVVQKYLTSDQSMERVAAAVHPFYQVYNVSLVVTVRRSYSTCEPWYEEPPMAPQLRTFCPLCVQRGWFGNIITGITSIITTPIVVGCQILGGCGGGGGGGGDGGGQVQVTLPPPPPARCSCELNLRNGGISYYIKTDFYVPMTQRDRCEEHDKYDCQTRCREAVENFVKSNIRQMCNNMIEYFTHTNIPLEVIIRRKYSTCEDWNDDRPLSNHLVSCFNPTTTVPPTTTTPKPPSPLCDCELSLVYNKVKYYENKSFMVTLEETNLCYDADRDTCRRLCYQKIDTFIKQNMQTRELCDNDMLPHFTNTDIGLDIIVKHRYGSCETWQEYAPYLTPFSCYIPTTTLAPIQCSCSLRYQRLTGLVPNFANTLEYPDSQVSFVIPRSEEVAICKRKCDEHAYSLIGLSPQQQMNHMCGMFAEPGQQIHTNGFALWVVVNGLAFFMESAGATCCRQQCICDILFRHIHNNTLGAAPLRSLDTPKRERGHQCHTDLSLCMVDCRNEAGKYFEEESIIDSNSTTPGLNVFAAPNYDSMAAISTCSRLAAYYPPEVKEWKANVYLRYDTGQGVFPFTDELSLGTICCLRFKPTLILPFECE